MFKVNYIKECERLGVLPSQTLLSQLNGDSDALLLSSTTLGTKTCLALSSALKHDTRFKTLALKDCYMGDDGMDTLADFIQGCIALAAFVKSNSTLQTLDLRGNNIRGDGSASLCIALLQNTSIKTLSLEWNCIGIWDSGIDALADMLRYNNTLTLLDLRNNKLSSAAICIICVSLKHNTALIRLDLRWNNAGISGGRAVLEMLEWNTTLQEVDLNGNDVSDDILNAICKLLLRELRVDTALKKNVVNGVNIQQNLIYAQELSMTVESLTDSHHASLRQMQEELYTREAESVSFCEKLSKASLEITECHDIQRMLEHQLLQTKNELESMNNVHTKEIKRLTQQYEEAQNCMLSERQRRITLECSRDADINENIKKRLEAESNFHDLVLQKDKILLLEEVEKYREREIRHAAMWEDKVKRIEMRYAEKLSELENIKDSTVTHEKKKWEAKMDSQRSENLRLEEALDLEREKWSNRRRIFDDETQVLVKKHDGIMDIIKRDYETQLNALKGLNDTLSKSQVEKDKKQEHALLNQEAGFLKRINDLEYSNSQELNSLRSRVKELISENELLTKSLSKNKEQERELTSLINSSKQELKEAALNSSKEISILKTIITDQEEIIAKRDKLIQQLKQDVNCMSDELNEKDQNYIIKMKELQLSINQLMEKRAMRSNMHNTNPLRS